jgi:biopolymer transport protein ExbB/TolQ
MNRSVAIIKVLIALCPLLGLLGTVTGILAFFEPRNFSYVINDISINRPGDVIHH